MNKTNIERVNKVKIFDLYGVNFIVESKLKWWLMKLQPWKYKEVFKGVMLKK